MTSRFQKTTLFFLLFTIIIEPIFPQCPNTQTKKIKKEGFLSKLASIWRWSSQEKLSDNRSNNKQEAILNDVAINNSFDHLRKLMKNERVKMVKKFIKKIPSLINKSDQNGITPLHIAVYYEDQYLVKFLLKRGAACDLRTNDGFTPFHIAVYRGAACDLRTNDGFTPFHIAVYKGNFDIINQLLATKEIDIDSSTTEDEYTPLHIAVRFFKSSHILEELVAAGAIINKQSKLGRTPLHLAVIRGDIAAIQLLLKKGAIVNTFSKKSDYDAGGKTPLDDAIDRGCFEIINLLKSYGAKPGIMRSGNANGTLSHLTKQSADYQLAQAADCLTREAMR